MQAPLFDTFQGRLRLEGVLTTRTGLHIGSGGGTDPLATDAPVVRNAAGEPFLPGASLKGVLRSAAESLMRGGTPRPGAEIELTTCEFLTGEPCVSHDEAQAAREEAVAKLEKDPEIARQLEAREITRGQLEERASRPAAEAIWRKSCTVCRLFGSLALASRVRFPDLPLAGGFSRFEVRNGVGIDRDRELAASGVLYDFEAVPPGTSFDLTVILDNASDAEIGLLLYLFEQLDGGHLALGGKTSRGLGQVDIEWRAIHEISLAKGNPFAELLSSRDLLAGPKIEEPESAEPAGPELPSGGDAEAWQTLADLLSEMPAIDKSELGQKAGPLGLTKDTLNDRLELGLTGRRAKKVWDEVLDRFVACGFLAETPSGWVLASASPKEESEAPAPEPGRDPALQAIYDRFIPAIARAWEEAH